MVDTGGTGPTAAAEKPAQRVGAAGRVQRRAQADRVAAIAPGLQHADSLGLPCYLESSNELNVPLYERHGFKVTREFAFPGGGPTAWLMWREPQR